MKYFILIFLFAFVSCDTETRPSSIIEKDKMIDIMAEALVLETYYQSLPGNPALNKQALDSTVNLVFKKSGITKNDFEESYLHYSKNLPEFQKMQEEIMEKLEKKAL
jgi:hypothetical protein